MRTAAYAALIVLAQAVSLEIASKENSPLLDVLAAQKEIVDAENLIVAGQKKIVAGLNKIVARAGIVAAQIDQEEPNPNGCTHEGRCNKNHHQKSASEKERDEDEADHAYHGHGRL